MTLDASDPIAQELHRADHDRFLSTLYAPAEKRHALTALYAFNVEIASVRDRIREALPGEVRLQWWRDVISTGSPDAASGHPLAQDLLKTIKSNDLPPIALENMIEARIFDLYNDPMPTRGDLEGYLGETASALIQLAALLVDRSAAPDFAEASGHAGCAQGIAGLLRLAPLHRARGQCYFPVDLLAAAGTDPAAFVAGSDGPANRRAVEAMVALGRDHWSKFLALAPRIPANIRSVFLPSALAPAYLKAAERAGELALSQPVDIAAWRKQWIMFRTAARGW